MAQEAPFQPFSSDAQIVKVGGMVIESSPEKVDCYGFLRLDRGDNARVMLRDFIDILTSTLAGIDRSEINSQQLCQSAN